MMRDTVMINKCYDDADVIRENSCTISTILYNQRSLFLTLVCKDVMNIATSRPVYVYFNYQYKYIRTVHYHAVHMYYIVYFVVVTSGQVTLRNMSITLYFFFLLYCNW